jgi:hypothetical protein
VDGIPHVVQHTSTLSRVTTLWPWVSSMLQDFMAFARFVNFCFSILYSYNFITHSVDIYKRTCIYSNVFACISQMLGLCINTYANTVDEEEYKQHMIKASTMDLGDISVLKTYCRDPC